jgi:hypothetical protein
MKLTADYRNGVVRLRSGEVCFIVDQSANTLTVRTVPKQRFCSLFTVPCDSLDLGIGKFRKSLLLSFQLLQLLTVGGCNLQKGVSLVMSKLISIRARSSMNMEGKGNQGKAAFGSTKLYSS